ncbi:DeoR/GlpR family DNA-binding transcription regulator [Parasedimentitalea psychrophila]|uniref:DeoR/GlpR family DNA-binding transcription regulator n=1 Tax=Parasedimentitalea psychrophila TaxID=2997337 RepID=A0A9Y2L0G2_9RHOB|nr:DeoR/GlpR family DNA-binding transcription regulator [Parasedimentitalea psychrophila]WIY25779.1 DeoR/GlpR family DNA-binding transcription regulator [Parasedimentitalea psychrophila]
MNTQPAAAVTEKPKRPATSRGAEILDLITMSGGSMRIHSIAEALDVSEETVRRNVRRLSEDGFVQKVHGGVLLKHGSIELSFTQRMDESPRAKHRIASHVAGLISNGSSLFLDIGSTTAFIANALKNHTELLVVTNSVAVAHTLAARNNNRVFMPGGELREHDGGIFGAQVLDFVGQFRTDFSVLSAAAINAKNGFMLFDLEEAQYSRAIMARSGTTIIAADSTKFGRSAPISIGDPSSVDLLITDATPPQDIVTAAKTWKTEIIVIDQTHRE